MIYMFLADGFEEVEALVPLDILRRANADILTVGVTGEYVKGAHNITVKADMTLDDVECEKIDAVILPGGLGGTNNMDNCAEVKKLVQYAADNRKLVCAICAAPSILGKMGLLEGKEATCYPGFEDTFKGGKYLKQSVVKCENFITSDGMGSAYKFGFEIAAALFGDDTAEKIKEQIQY
jgi:4-methyl-5(b-hydroxyethyl)-thiazole monophosphate biosynthesis